MPLYEFKCKSCGHEFEEILSYSDRDSDVECKLCGSESERKPASSFGIHNTLDPKKDTISSNKEIDKVIGAAAERKWEGYDERWRNRYEQRQQKRWNGKKPKQVDIPKDSDGKYSPVMHLGNKKQKALRKEYSEALQEHRVERKKKGLEQFDSKGAIVDG